MRSFCKECGVHLCFLADRTCFRLYHSKSNALAISVCEFVSSMKSSKPSFMCFVKRDNL